jgi:hypothetical protein
VRRLGGTLVAVIIASLLSSHATAVASCPAPTAKVRPTRVARGATVTVTGQFFGDDCLDTGTVPAGVGPLGDPLTGLTIVIDQADREYVVATGSADSDYEFTVDIVVPAGLEPGQATVSIIAGDARMNLATPLAISAVSPIGKGDAAVATFGPDTVAPTGTGVTEPPPPVPAEIPDVQPSTTVAVDQSVAPLDQQGNPSQTWRAYGLVVGGVAVLMIIGFVAWSRSRRWQ